MDTHVEEKKKEHGFHKPIKILCLGLACVFFVITLLCSVIIIKGWLEPDRPPSVFGFTPVLMADDCMESERADAIAYGDILLLK